MNTEIVVVPAIFYALYSIIKVISENRLKRMMIEKGQIDESIRLFEADRNAFDNYNSLKWGIILVAIGSAFFLGHLLPRYFSDEGLLGFALILAGSAMIIFHMLSAKAAAGSDAAPDSDESDEK